MAHDTTTYTIILSFWAEGKAATDTPPKHGTLEGLTKSYRNDSLWSTRTGAFTTFSTRAAEAAHDVLVGSTASFVADWLDGEVDSGRVLADNVGFTARKTTGGGAEWPLERGVELTLAGLTASHHRLVLDLAEALRVREGQYAVAVLSRNEGFSLVLAK